MTRVEQCGRGGGHTGEEEAGEPPAWTSLERPPFYNGLFVVVTSACVAGMTWLARSGALQMWDRHPRPGETWEYAWPIALLIGVPGGLIVGLLLMGQLLMWYQRRVGHGEEVSGGQGKG